MYIYLRIKYKQFLCTNHSSFALTMLMYSIFTIKHQIEEPFEVLKEV